MYPPRLGVETWLRAMLERDRKRNGFTVGQVPWRLGISPREYRDLVEGEDL